MNGQQDILPNLNKVLEFIKKKWNNEDTNFAQIRLMHKDGKGCLNFKINREVKK